MPSLFSRSRTNSTPQKKTVAHTDTPSPASLDEFGRVQSRNSHRGSPFGISYTTPTKKDKKRAKELAKRNKALGARADTLDADVDQPALPDGSFLPLSLEPPKNDTAVGEQARETDYGYLSYERHVVLGLEQLEALVNVVVEELETRGGITTPFIFSTTALDISASAIRRLIRSFLDMCSVPSRETERAWREEARFAGPHELGMCLRWGLARVVRVSAGIDVRGLISWDIYLRFRDSEAANGYPPGLFEVFLDELEPTLQVIVVRILSLLTRLTANSTSSGHTPPTLSPLFGPLLFGLGPATLAFHHTYVHYLRAVNATEHIILAFIRWQDAPRSSTMPLSGSAAALGVPIRLKEWIKGYPAMLPYLHEQKNVKPHPRKGAKTMTMTTVRRNVRMYSPDLVKTAATWAHRTKSSNGVINGLANSKEWGRIAPSTLKLPPRYSETYKKRMNLPPSFHPETAPGITYSNSNNTTSSTVSRTTTLASTLSIGTISQSNSVSNKDYFELGKREGEDRFRSLTDLKWGEFESMGFSNIGDDKKLQFDLTESAREARAAKRQTMSWNDFSAAGFSRTDEPLNDTLQFSTPLKLTVSNWPNKDVELTKKIKKTEKQLPPFGWDTEPVMGSEEIIEESFVDVFCDLVYGGGWMDLERGEGLDKDINWALVEFKSLPPSSRATVAGGSDPRISSTLILFEEFVPLEYRQQLAIKSTTRRRIPAFFSPSKKQWKQAATLNGRPYVVGHVPRSPSYREMEFEGLLQGASGTKVISLGSKASTRVVSTASNTTAGHGNLDTPRSPPPPVPLLPSQPSSSFSPQQVISNAPSTTTNMASPKTLPKFVPLTPGSHSKSSRSDEGLRSTASESTSHTTETLSPSLKKQSTSASGSSSGGATSKFKLTNVISATSSPRKRISQIITMPGTGPGVPPAEYSAVEFETRFRLAGSLESDDDDGDSRHGGERDYPGGDFYGHGNGVGARSRKKKRDVDEVDDDAWVDILVNSHSRRIVGQDVDPSRPTSKGGAAVGDPDMASLEVAQVLAAVRSHQQRSPSLGSLSSSTPGRRLHRNGEEDVDFESQDHHGVAREHGPSVDMDAHVEGLVIDEIERVPRRIRTGSESVESDSSLGHGGRRAGRMMYDEDGEDEDGDGDGEEYAADDEEHSQELSNSQSHSHSHAHAHIPPQELEPEEPPLLAVRHALRQQRRLGYFDLHPERKQLYSSPPGQSPNDDDDDLLHSHHVQQSSQQHVGTVAAIASSPSPDVPSFDSTFERRRAEMEKCGVAKADSTILPSISSANGSASTTSITPSVISAVTTPSVNVTTAPIAHPVGPRAPANTSSGAGAGAGTKTAALIEMYRERERRAASSTPTISSIPSVATVVAPTLPPIITLPLPAVPQPLAPSRIPIRSTSLPGATNANTNIATISLPSSSPPSTTPEPVVPATTFLTPDGDSGVDFIDPLPPVPFKDPGRDSPARYVHGAPLHNVLEEEEEE